MTGVVRVGFIGAGKMAGALARGFAKTLPTGSKTISASCPPGDACLLDEIRDMGCNTMHSNEDLVNTSDVIMLAVKPSIVPIVLKEVKHLVDPSKLVVSIAAGLKIQELENVLNEKSKVVRVMTNTPSMVGEGATAYSLGKNVTQDEGKVVERLFSGVGRECHPVHENLMDAVTGVSGSGPAYMYLIIEALADAGVKQGLSRDLAYRLAAQTMVGAGKMVLDTGKHPGILKDDVCSPAGSTIAAVHVLEKCGLRNAIIEATQAATNRCVEMGT